MIVSKRNGVFGLVHKIFYTPVNSQIDQAKRQGYDLSFHSLRHSHASILIMIYKVPIKTVSRRLGHADITVTLSIYTQFINELDEEAAAAMDNIFAVEAIEEASEESSSEGNDTDLTRQD